MRSLRFKETSSALAVGLTVSLFLLGIAAAGKGDCPSLLKGTVPFSGLGVDFTPVGSGAGVHAALRSNLKIVRDWLNDKDFLSAAETAQGLTALAWLYSFQSTEPSWQAKTAALKDACSKLAASAKAKDAGDCEKQSQFCEKLLQDLEQNPPLGSKVVEKRMKPFGATKTWMSLMDGAYTDAKTAKTAKEMEHMASAIAEEVNVVAHLRDDARWQRAAGEVREIALRVAAEAKGDDLAQARADLKTIYNRCQACHEAFRR